MRIVWAKTAKKRLVEILDYIQLKFGDNITQSFRTKTRDFTRLLSEFS